MTTFKLAFHMVDGRRVVEVFDGDTFIAGLYPGDDPRSFRVISKFPITTATAADPNDGRGPNVVDVKIGDKTP